MRIVSPEVLPPLTFNDTIFIGDTIAEHIKKCLIITPALFRVLILGKNEELLDTLTFKKKATEDRTLVAIALRIKKLPKKGSPFDSSKGDRVQSPYPQATYHSVASVRHQPPAKLPQDCVLLAACR